MRIGKKDRGKGFSMYLIQRNSSIETVKHETVKHETVVTISPF